MASPDIECSNSSSEGSNIIAKANNYLALNLHKQLASEKENVFFSPFSISTTLAMLLCGAKDKTAKELQKVCGYDETNAKKENIPSYFFQFFSTMKDKKDGYVLNCANCLLSQKDFIIKDTYKQLLKESFRVLLLEVDLKEQQKIVDQINEWVKETTNNMIPRVLEKLDPATLMVILNAIYFKGTWMDPFKKENTRLQNFYNKGSKKNQKQVEMMHLKARFPFVKKKNFKALQLPYEGEDNAMLILLPNSIDGLEKLERSLDVTFLKEIRKKMTIEDVDVALPKFRLEYSKSLKEILAVLGMKRIFHCGADLGGISDSKNLQVTEVIHTAVLEEGCEAAAATIFCYPTSVTVNPEFIVDHPFLFVIYDLKSNLILFMGRVDEL